MSFSARLMFFRRLIYIIESTYGNSLHEDIDNTQNSCCNGLLKPAVEKKGKLIIHHLVLAAHRSCCIF